MPRYFKTIRPLPELEAYIKRIWIFEADGRLPEKDIRLLIPADHTILLFPVGHHIMGTFGGKDVLIPRNMISLIGIFDGPVCINNHSNGRAAGIGVEFRTSTGYLFLNMRMRELRNQVLMASVLGGKWRYLDDVLDHYGDTLTKAEQLQRFLRRMLRPGARNALFDFCVRRIAETGGNITVSELERETGFSSRWLNIKFEEYIGISPKMMISIHRFHHCYTGLLTDPGRYRLSSIYEDYYDRSHFIREFRRYTGMSPTRLLASSNEFGKSYYST